MPSNRRGEGEFRHVSMESSRVFVEGQLLTCAHCNTSVVCAGELRKRPRNWCAKCDRYICDRRSCIENCTPIEQLKDLLFSDKPPKEGVARAFEAAYGFKFLGGR